MRSRAAVQRDSISPHPALPSSVGWRGRGHGPAGRDATVILLLPRFAHCLITTAPLAPRSPRAHPQRSFCCLSPPAAGRKRGDGAPTCRDQQPVSPQTAWGAGDRRGCTGTAIQECCFFHPGFRQGSKSALQKAFVSPRTLRAAVPASPGLARRSQPVAIPAHTHRSCSSGSSHPSSCQGKQSHPSHCPCAPSLSIVPCQRGLPSLHPAQPSCAPPVAIPFWLQAEALPWEDIGVAQVTPHRPQPCKALGFSSGVLVQGKSPHRQLGRAFPQHTAQPSWPGIQGAGRDIGLQQSVCAQGSQMLPGDTRGVSGISREGSAPLQNHRDVGLPLGDAAIQSPEGKGHGRKAPRGEGKCPAPLRGHSAAGPGEV